jgi:Na+-driven multidrug efflux pump
LPAAATSAAAFAEYPDAQDLFASGSALPYPLHWNASYITYIAMRFVVIAFLAIIVMSLGSAMFYLIRDKGKSDRTVRALTVRVGLSVTLFLLLMLGHYFGIIPKSGL